MINESKINWINTDECINIRDFQNDVVDMLKNIRFKSNELG
ncbi:Uncharacterised protein [Clostridium carnis]|uniref:Uncharacterized protein n=1 Tax=Clostridium carnis TaxID=1530 RepID=A0ABY6SNV8_9CLOT|nr:hypothetical protein [Clostridium carnis]VDG69836.1 Uncharacterised protein [Clostridium carnis]